MRKWISQGFIWKHYVIDFFSSFFPMFLFFFFENEHHGIFAVVLADTYFQFVQNSHIKLLNKLTRFLIFSALKKASLFCKLNMATIAGISSMKL